MIVQHKMSVFFFAKASLTVSDTVCTPQLVRHCVFSFSLEQFHKYYILRWWKNLILLLNMIE